MDDDPTSNMVFSRFFDCYFFTKKKFRRLIFLNTFFNHCYFFVVSTKNLNKEDYYSPYQVITVEHYPNSNLSIKASNLWFQSPHDFRQNTNWNSYFVPFKVATKNR